MSEPQPMRRGSRAFAIVGITLWLLAPVAAIVVLAVVAASQKLTHEPETVWVPAQSSDATTSVPVDLMVAWATPDPLRAPGWSGVLQAILVTPGDVVLEGTRIARVDGIDRIAARSGEPFYRSITRNDVGSDVTALNAFLARSGFASGPADRATLATMTGVRQLGISLGVSHATAFDPAWVVFLPGDSFTVATIDLAVGTTAPAFGENILEGTSYPASATLVPQGAFSNEVLIADKAPSPDDIERRAITADDEQEVRIGQTAVGLTNDRAHLDEDALAVITEIVTPGTFVVQVNLVRLFQQEDIVVPSAAIFVNADGASCVYVEGRESATVVEVIADTGGRTIIHGDVTPEERVRVPGAGDQRRCG